MAVASARTVRHSPETLPTVCSDLQPAPRSNEASAACGGVAIPGARTDRRSAVAAPTAGGPISPPKSQIQVERVAETHSCRGRRLQPAFPVCSKRHHSAVRHGNGPQSNLTAAPQAKKPCAEAVEIAPLPGIPALVPSNLLIWVAMNLLFPTRGMKIFVQPLRSQTRCGNPGFSGIAGESV